MAAMKGRGISIIFLGLSAIFYIMAIGLAFGAESRRSTVVVQHGKSLSYCIYSKSGATTLAIVAFVLLFFAQGMVMANTRWCWGPSLNLDRGEHRVVATILIGFSWFSFVTSETLLVAAIIVNSLPTKGAHDCSKLQNGVFASAGAFTLLNMILSAAYLMLVLTASGESSMDSSVMTYVV